MTLQPYVGEIRMFGGNFAPQYWAFCHGQLLNISEQETLYTLIGTTYGGDGQDTFGLPDLRGRAIIGQGQGSGLSDYQLGEAGGAEDVTLSLAQIPGHAIPTSSQTRTRNRPAPLLGLATGGAYVPSADANTTQGSVGGSQPHENMPPFLVINFIISLTGIYPSQS